MKILTTMGNLGAFVDAVTQLGASPNIMYVTQEGNVTAIYAVMADGTTSISCECLQTSVDNVLNIYPSATEIRSSLTMG